MDKRVLTELGRQAEKLPPMATAGLVKQQDRFGRITSIPVAVPVNHKRRMKKLLKRYGIAGVEKYLADVDKLETGV